MFFSYLLSINQAEREEIIGASNIDPCRAIFTAISKKQKAKLYVSR